MVPDESWVTCRIRTAQTLRTKLKKMGLPLLTEKNCRQNLDDLELGYLWWRRLYHEGTASWRNRSAWGMATDPTNVTRCWIQLMAQGPPRIEDLTHSLLTSMRQATGKRTEKRGGVPTKKPRDLAPLVLEVPAQDNTLILEIRGDSKAIVDWVNGHSKRKTKEDTIASVRISCGIGGIVAWIFDTGSPVGRLTSSASTTRKPIPGVWRQRT